MTGPGWGAPCPLCDQGIDNATAAGHLRVRHGMVLCGVRAEGLSLADVNELCAFYRRLQAKGRGGKA